MLMVKLFDELCDKLDESGIEGNVIERDSYGRLCVGIWYGKFEDRPRQRPEGFTVVITEYSLCFSPNGCYEIKPPEKYCDYFKDTFMACASRRSGFYVMSSDQIVRTIKFLFNREKMEKKKENNMEGFSLNTCLIPELTKCKINFRILRYDVGNLKRPESLIVDYKYINICRVDQYHQIGSSACYKVVWHAKTIDHHSTIEYYSRASDLVRDIRKVIDFNFKPNHINGGEYKMNNKIYKVTNIEHRCSPTQLDEITLTVNVFGSRCTSIESTDDCIRIKKAIESISDTKESNNHDWVSEFSNYLVRTFDKTSIKDVIFNNPATIVFWGDGTKTVVKAENEKFDPEKGLAMAIAKRALGGKHDYYDVFKKYVGRYEKKQKKGEK